MTEYYFLVSEASDRTSLFLWPTTDEAAAIAAQQEYGREALHCVVRGVGGDWEPERPMQGIALRSWGCKKDVTTFTVSRSGRIIATVDGVGTLNVFEWPTTISPRMQAVRDRIKDLENAEIAAAQEAARQAAEAAELSNVPPDEAAIAAADAANEALGRERVRAAAAAERRELTAARKLESKERDKVRNAARRERGRSGDGFA